MGHCGIKFENCHDRVFRLLEWIESHGGNWPLVSEIPEHLKDPDIRTVANSTGWIDYARRIAPGTHPAARVTSEDWAKQRAVYLTKDGHGALGLYRLQRQYEAANVGKREKSAPTSSTAEKVTEPALNDCEVCIIEALGNGRLTGERIAEKAGYPFNSNFKKTLAELVKQGRLTNINERGNRGYQVVGPLS